MVDAFVSTCCEIRVCLSLLVSLASFSVSFYVLLSPFIFFYFVPFLLPLLLTLLLIALLLFLFLFCFSTWTGIQWMVLCLFSIGMISPLLSVPSLPPLLSLHFFIFSDYFLVHFDSTPVVPVREGGGSRLRLYHHK